LANIVSEQDAASGESIDVRRLDRVAHATQRLKVMIVRFEQNDVRPTDFLFCRRCGAIIEVSCRRHSDDHDPPRFESVHRCTFGKTNVKQHCRHSNFA
jgi:hypothetical protein